MIDCEEADRWLKMAKHTIDAIKADIESDFYAWACFKAQQSAETSLKALLRGLGYERASEHCTLLRNLHDCVVVLDRLYIPTRNLDAWPGDAVPYENYTLKDAQEAEECALKIYDAVSGCLKDVRQEGGA